MVGALGRDSPAGSHLRQLLASSIPRLQDLSKFQPSGGNIVLIVLVQLPSGQGVDQEEVSILGKGEQLSLEKGRNLHSAMLTQMRLMGLKRIWSEERRYTHELNVLCGNVTVTKGRLWQG